MQDGPLLVSGILRRGQAVYGDSRVVTVRDRRVPGVDLHPGGGAGRAAGQGPAPPRRRRRRPGRPPSPGTTRSTSRPTWPSPPWGRCSTPSTSACSPSSSPTSSTTPRTRSSSSTRSIAPLFARVRDECKTVEHIIVVGEGDTTGLGRHVVLRRAHRRRGAGIRLARPRRTPGGVDVLHERHHGQPQGGRLQPPLDVAARLRRHDVELRGRQRDATACSSSSPCSTPTRGACPTRPSSPGTDLIFPERFLQAEPLARIIAEQRPTLSLGVPTIWNDLLHYSQSHDVDLSSLRLLTAGGSAVPRSLMEAYQERFGIDMIQGWGMTETSPVCAFGRAPKGVPPEQEMDWRAKTGPHHRRRGAPGRGRGGRGAAQRRHVGGRVRGARAVGHGRVLRGPRPRALPRRVAAHRGRGEPRRPRLHADLGPHQGRHQVRGGVDLVGRARERGDGPPRRVSRRRSSACPTSAGTSAPSWWSCRPRAPSPSPPRS